MPFSRSERVELAFGKTLSIQTITLLKLPFDTWQIGLCYLVCSKTNVNFILAKATNGLGGLSGVESHVLVFVTENEGTTWRQLAVVDSLTDVDAVICAVF